MEPLKVDQLHGEAQGHCLGVLVVEDDVREWEPPTLYLRWPHGIDWPERRDNQHAPDCPRLPEEVDHGQGGPRLAKAGVQEQTRPAPLANIEPVKEPLRRECLIVAEWFLLGLG